MPTPSPAYFFMTTSPAAPAIRTLSPFFTNIVRLSRSIVKTSSRSSSACFLKLSIPLARLSAPLYADLAPSDRSFEPSYAAFTPAVIAFAPSGSAFAPS